MLDPQSSSIPPGERFVRIPLADAAGAASRVAGSRDVVLARRDGPVLPDALVVARRDQRVSLCRVTRVTDDALEMLPVEGDGAPLRVARDGPDVLGTVLLRWRDGES
ncbi:MAG TPA: hypothetical protein VFS08_10695 [Gemmatimonadaceae bacterium]|nr:hypothetical protein [Gemmatimonadaceae bacterium]